MSSKLNGPGSYFCKDDKGNDIFFPWMSPGEAFFIGAEQKKHIRLMNTIIGVLTLVMFGAALHFYDKGPENFIFSMWILILLFPVFGFIYFATLATYIKTQKMQPATTIHQQGLPALVRSLLTILIVEVITVLAALYFRPDYSGFKLVLGAMIVIDLLLVALVIKSKGRILQNRL